jgi:hypothetical protein
LNGISAYRLLLPLADEGDAEAQANIGEMVPQGRRPGFSLRTVLPQFAYAKGRGVPQRSSLYPSEKAFNAFVPAGTKISEPKAAQRNCRLWCSRLCSLSLATEIVPKAAYRGCYLYGATWHGLALFFAKWHCFFSQQW